MRFPLLPQSPPLPPGSAARDGEFCCLQPFLTRFLSHKTPPFLLGAPFAKPALSEGWDFSEPSTGAVTSMGAGGYVEESPFPHLLRFPPQHYFLLSLLRFQSPDLELHERERKRNP